VVEVWLQNLYQWWMGGIRTTAAFVDKFSANTTDTRGQFYKDGQTKEIKNIGTYRWICIQKFRNVTVNGVQGSDKAGNSDADFPIFRLADAYLMYAECCKRWVEMGQQL
jgi:hypothetical protein